MEILARAKPVLMTYEDVHWIDPTSLEAVGRTVDRLRTLGGVVDCHLSAGWHFRSTSSAREAACKRHGCLIAVKLGGWKAYETIKSSDKERTNPGSVAMIAILKEAAPCIILLDEVVAYA